MLGTVLIILYFLFSVLSNEDRNKAKHLLDQINDEEGCLDDKTCEKILQDFETKVSEIKHVFCSSCMCVSQRLDLVHLGDGTKVCKQCNTRKSFTKDQTTTHPIWFDKDNICQYG